MKHKNAPNRVGEIELWRVVFSLIIMIRHGEYLLGHTDFPFSGGAFAVEFFFLVSGYLMMATLTKREGTPCEHLGSETLGFVGRKLAAFYPEMLVSYIIGFVFEASVKGLDLYGAYRLFAEHPFEILMLRMTGIGSNSINSPVWYLQTMIFCMFVLYPIIRKFPNMMKCVIMPLSAWLILGWLYREFGHLRNPSMWIDFTLKGNLRGMAEICLGATAYPVVQWLKKFNLTTFWRVVFAAVKWVCWLLLLYYMYSYKLEYDFFYLLVFIVAVILAFSQQCIDAPWYQNKVIYWLGKISLPLYLSHIFYAQNLTLLLPNMTDPRKLFALYFACAGVTAVAVHWGGKGVRLLAGKIRAQFLRMRSDAND